MKALLTPHPFHAAALPLQEPTLAGDMGTAWLYDLDGMYAKAAAREQPMPPRQLGLPSWLVYAPWAHPIWHSYCLMVISLAEVEGFPPAHINRPGENPTHELFLAALDPGMPSNPRARYALDEPAPMMRPLNFAAQFKEGSDAKCSARIRAAVEDIIRGRLNPDTDGMQQWIGRFGGSSVKGDVSSAGQTQVKARDGRIEIHGTGASAVAIAEAVAPLFGGVKAEG
jgi:hypothetical protein